MVINKMRRDWQGGNITPFSLEDSQGPSLSVYKIEERKLQHLDKTTVVVRSYFPTELSAGNTQPVIVFAHGGGWVGGSLDLYDKPSRRLAIVSGCKVDLVNYRLSPKNPYPAPVQDILLAFDDARRHTKGEIHFFGDSAGANVALGATLLLRDTTRQLPDSLTLFYPPVDPRLQTESYIEHSENGLLSELRMSACWSSYAGGQTYKKMRYACLRNANFSYFPRTSLFISEQDILRDECLWLAKKMKVDGVKLFTQLLKGMPHSAIHFCGINNAAERLYDQAAEFITGRASDTS